MRGVNPEKGYHACKDTTFSYIPKIFLSLKECGTPFLVAADELEYSRVLAHDAHGLQFRGRVDGAGDEMCQRGVYLYVAPASLLRSLSISTYRIAYRHTHSTPISRA